MTPALDAYRALTRAATPLAPFLLRARARRGKEDAARLGERLGRASRGRPEGRLAWLHGASVGESLSLLPLVAALRSRRPDLGVLVTSGTTSSARLLAERLPADCLHQFVPIDAPGPARRFARRWRPDLAVFVESELWPNLLLETRAAGARTALVSARLSAGSVRGWTRARASARALLGGFDLVLAQDAAGARDLEALGARDVGLLNLKRCMPPPPVRPDHVAAIRRWAQGRPVLVAASTHPGEERLVLEAFRSSGAAARLVLAPRHPERAEAIARELAALGAASTRRSRGELPGEAVHMVDVLGELGDWYAAAAAAFIGGSLLEGPGGHNPLEAAHLACPILTGPHVDNWREVYEELFAADAAVRTSGVGGLAAAFAEAAGRPELARARAERALRTARRGDADLDDAAARLERLLP